MAIIKNCDDNGKYLDDEALKAVSKYIARKASSMIYCGTDAGYVDKDMAGIQKRYQNEDGKKLQQLVISFSRSEKPTQRELIKIAHKVCRSIYEDGYQVMAGVHMKKANRHVHIMANTTNFKTGEKLKPDWYISDIEREKIKLCLQPYEIKFK